MVYLLYTLYSTISLSILSKYREANYKKLIFVAAPMIFAWILIVGGQYDVGTDYHSYMHIFYGYGLERTQESGEVGFVHFVKLCNSIGLRGQDLFFIISVFWVFSLLYFSKRIVSSKYVFIFIFVFITFSTTFNNQMNGIRQYVATYFFTFCVLFLLDRKYILSILFFLLARSWHASALILIPVLILFLAFKNTNNKKVFYILVVLSIVFNQLFKEEWLFPILLSIGFYDQYVGKDYVQEIEFINKLTKIINVPIVLLSIYKLDKYRMRCFDKKIYSIGICSYCIYLASLSLTITNRFGMYFTILMCIPIAYYLIYLYRSKNLNSLILFWLILFYFLAQYIVKVIIFPLGEYSYDSIFMH